MAYLCHRREMRVFELYLKCPTDKKHFIYLVIDIEWFV